MDLTLEIFGWVESLEDALTQFTSAEDLDGENMYRCGRLDYSTQMISFQVSSENSVPLYITYSIIKRCAAYVRAHKQLSIQEAPNILTIVLKRFQVSTLLSSMSNKLVINVLNNVHQLYC